jgi:hypothetical protein
MAAEDRCLHEIPSRSGLKPAAMGLMDMLGMGRDPALEHLVQVYDLQKAEHPLHGRCWQGSAHGQALRVVAEIAQRKGLQLELGQCAAEPCFGFYRAPDEDLREAADFAADWLARFQEGEDVRVGGFLLDYEGGPEWQAVIGKHALAIGDYLARYSPSLRWVYLNSPGLSFLLESAPEKKPPDLPAIERDVATSARLLDYLRETLA